MSNLTAFLLLGQHGMIWYADMLYGQNEMLVIICGIFNILIPI